MVDFNLLTQAAIIRRSCADPKRKLSHGELPTSPHSLQNGTRANALALQTRTLLHDVSARYLNLSCVKPQCVL